MSTFFIDIMDLRGDFIGKIGRPSGGKNHKWSKDEKLCIIQKYLNGSVGINKFAKELGISRGMLWRWIESYRELGEKGLEPSKKKASGNHFAAIHRSKSISEEERLKLIIAKQAIEIERLKKGYLVKGDGAKKDFVIICEIMNVNRSGYYKWKLRKGIKNRYEKKRGLLIKAHEKHKSYGYHRLSTIIRREMDFNFSDNLAHKCCKLFKIKSKAKHYRYRKSGEEHIIYPNKIRGNWNASKPLEIVVSDMTNIKYKGQNYEWTYLLDTYNNEIISHHLSKRQGDRDPYFNCLNELKQMIKEQKTQTVLHTDQGTVYSSKAFHEAHKDCNIVRSMSRVGTPTDNPIIESINGWIKEEMRVDFQYWKSDNIFNFVDSYVNYFNNERPAYALNYKSPIQYRTERGFA